MMEPATVELRVAWMAECGVVWRVDLSEFSMGGKKDHSMVVNWEPLLAEKWGETSVAKMVGR